MSDDFALKTCFPFQTFSLFISDEILMIFKGFKQTPKCKKSRHPLTEKGPVQLAGTARVWPGAECLLTSGHFVLWELLEACYPSLFLSVYPEETNSLLFD